MTVDWSREDVAAATRAQLLRAGAVTDGFAGIDVVAESDSMLVVFRWHRDPNVYAIEVEYPTAPASPMTGESVDSASEWAQHLEWHLAEELDTGLVQRARPTVRDGRVLLDPDDAPDVSPAGFYIDPVPLDEDQLTYSTPLRRLFGHLRQRVSAILGTLSRGRRPPAYAGLPPAPTERSPASDVGWWLAEAGMDVTVPKRLLAEDRLACWFQASADNGGGEPFVGQAAASWEDESRTTVRLDLLNTLPGIPSDVRHALARYVIFAATEAGAQRVVTTMDDPALHRLGFRAASNGGFAVGTTAH